MDAVSPGRGVYRVAADNVASTSAWSNTLTVSVARPATPTILTATTVRSGSAERVTLTWSPVPWATSYVIQRSADPAFASGVTTTALGNVTTYTTGNIARRAWSFPVFAVNVLGQSDPSTVQTLAAAP